MSTNEDLSARLYVRLYTSLLDDPDMVELSYSAVGVYAATLLLSKHTATDGWVPLKLLRRDAALRAGTPLEEALDELAGAGLVTVADGVVTVRSWDRYITPSAEIEARRKARQESARRANHDRWGHLGPLEACRRCNKDVSPSESESDPPRIRDRSEEGPQSYSYSDSQSESHSHSDGPDPDLWITETGPDEGRAAAADDVDPNRPEVVALADSLMEHAGILGSEAPVIIRRHVAQALAAHRGDASIVSRIIDAAVAVGSQPDVRKPEGLLRKKLEDLAYPARAGPAAAESGGWQAAWAEAERTLAGSWRGVDFAATGLPERTIAALVRIRRMFSDAGATKHDTQAAFRDAWLTAEPAPP